MRGDRDRVLDMVEMCDLLIRHASDRARLADDPVIQDTTDCWDSRINLHPDLVPSFDLSGWAQR